MRAYSLPRRVLQEDDDAGWIDLLADLDLKKHTLRGSARIEKRAIDTNALKAPVLICTKQTAPANYEIRATVTRLDGVGAVFFVLPLENTPVALVIDSSFKNFVATGLALVDGKAPNSLQYAAKVWKGELLPKGQTCELHFRIHKNAIVVYVDGYRVFQWSGDTKRLSLTPFFKNKYPKHILFGSGRSRFRVESLQYRPAM